MNGFGMPEFFVILIIIAFVYGVFMTIDAIRRPADKYTRGNKRFWISLLILTNPLLSRFYPGLLYLLALLCFVAGSVAYHVTIRNGAPPTETIETSREERRRKRFEAR